MTGTVKWFDEKKGFGFIACDERRRDVFVHYTAINSSGYRKLEQDQRVKFDIAPTPKGDQAENVEVIE